METLTFPSNAQDSYGASTGLGSVSRDRRYARRMRKSWPEVRNISPELCPWGSDREEKEFWKFPGMGRKRTRGRWGIHWKSRTKARSGDIPPCKGR